MPKILKSRSDLNFCDSAYLVSHLVAQGSFSQTRSHEEDIAVIITINGQVLYESVPHLENTIGYNIDEEGGACMYCESQGTIKINSIAEKNLFDLIEQLDDDRTLNIMAESYDYSCNSCADKYLNLLSECVRDTFSDYFVVQNI